MEESHLNQRAGRIAATEVEIDAILADAKCIAVVGLSQDPGKTSHRIAKYLQDVGYRIIPVNPTADNIIGEKVYRSLSEIPHRVDLVDVFRPPQEALGIVQQTAQQGIPVIWFQLQTTSNKAVREAVAGGLCVVHDRCLMVEHRRGRTGLG